MKSYLDFITENNPDNLPVVIMNENWCEGSPARYSIGDCLNTAKNYDAFIKKVRSLYKSKDVLFCHVRNYLTDADTTITIGTII